MSKKLTLLSTALLVATAILAQQDTSYHSLDEVVVTANKVAQKQSSTGKVVTVISKEEIEKSTGKTVSQLLNEQVGMVINGALNNAGAVQNVNMRGSSSGHTLILIDGIPASDPSDINNNFDLNFLSLNNIERIEICKGAQSTLYGSDAVAGVVNIISKKSTSNKLVNGSASVSGGSYNTYKANAQLNGGFNKFKYNVSYTKSVTDGFSAAYDSSNKGGFDKDGYNGDVVNASLQYQATKELSVKAYTMYSGYKTDVDAGAFSDKKFYTVQNRSDIDGVGFNYAKGSFVLVGNYQYNKVKRIYDDNYSNGNPFFFYSKYNSNSQFAELYTNVKCGGGFSLLGGAEYRYGSMNNAYKGTGYSGGFNDTSINQKSVYASINFIDNSKKLTVELGGRLNNHSQYGTNYTYTFNPSYTIDNHFRVFGSIATAYKVPSLFQLYADFGTGNKNLQPEKSVNYEVGFQEQFKGFSNRLVLFYRDITDGIDYNNNLYQYFNYAAQTARGIEYEVSVKPIKQMSITANYTYLATNQNVENRVTSKDTLYGYTLHVPKHNINLTVGYQITPAFYVSVSGKYVSSRYDLGGYDAFFNPLPDVTLDSYFIVGAYAQYVVNKNIKLFADGKNITNQKFFDVRGYNSIPSMFNGGITVNW